jgi:hypothetical protein
MADVLELEVSERPNAPGQGAGAAVRRLFDPIASLRLTVLLFALAIVLVFCGTLAQVDQGIWTVVSKYFRTAFVWIPFQVFFPRSITVPGGFPFPGGWLIGGLLLANLIAAHVIRFKVSWKRSGILLIHAGLIVMLLSELVTGLMAVEGNMTIPEGQSRNYTENTRKVELAVVRRADDQHDDVVVVPGSRLRPGSLLRHEEMPFDVELVRYMVNSEIISPAEAGAAANPATHGAGLVHIAQEKPEVSGADPEQTVDLPSAYVSLYQKSGELLGTYLVSMWLKEQKISVNGETYDVALRSERTYKPYSLHLIDFRHEKYLGTDKPKDFSSEVRLMDPEQNVDRRVRIYMNHPLRYRGETFYQSSFLPGDTGTVLHVVRNPGWLMPYISCAMVSVGMLIHFGLHLYGFLERRRTALELQEE